MGPAPRAPLLRLPVFTSALEGQTGVHGQGRVPGHDAAGRAVTLSPRYGRRGADRAGGCLHSWGETRHTNVGALPSGRTGQACSRETQLPSLATSSSARTTGLRLGAMVSHPRVPPQDHSVLFHSLSRHVNDDHSFHPRHRGPSSSHFSPPPGSTSRCPLIVSTRLLSIYYVRTQG